MTTDRQKVCKCGNSVAEFLNDASIFEANIRVVKVETSGTYIQALKDSVNDIYRNINKIEDNCNIDARETKWGSSDIFNKVEQMEAIKDHIKFNARTSDILTDLSRIRYGVVQKVKDCSK